MGCSVSCALFEKFSSFLEFRAKLIAQSSLITHYLGDFLFVGPNQASYSALLSSFTAMCGELGVPLAWDKTVGPTQIITYLGLEIDTRQGEVSVPEVKVQKVIARIQQALCKTKITSVRVQSIVGSLNFLCKAIAPGRAFMRRCIALSHGLTKPSHKDHITYGARLDLLMWLECLSHFNGVSPFLSQDLESNGALQLYTDAAGSIGFGAYFECRWVQGRWPADVFINPPSIAFLECFPLVVAL